MTTEIHQQIRHMMRQCGVWNYATVMRIYTTKEFISELGHYMSPELIELLKNNVKQLQADFDKRVLVPLN